LGIARFDVFAGCEQRGENSNRKEPFHILIFIHFMMSVVECLQNLTTTAVGATVGGAAGYVGGGLAVTGVFYAVGLSTLGPVAGGLFAANMGAGVAAGSMMAVAQSMAMTTGTYVTGGVVGAVAGTGVGGYLGATNTNCVVVDAESWITYGQSMAMTTGTYLSNSLVGTVAQTGLGDYFGANTP
jgi:hypothetical protein